MSSTFQLKYSRLSGVRVSASSPVLKTNSKRAQCSSIVCRMCTRNVKAIFAVCLCIASFVMWLNLLFFQSSPSVMKLIKVSNVRDAFSAIFCLISALTSNADALVDETNICVSYRVSGGRCSYVSISRCDVT